MGLSASARGYGKMHQRAREGLMLRLRDGTPCPWCGRPMYAVAVKNFDGKPLAADHLNFHGARNGELPERLLHFTCNSQRGGGEVATSGVRKIVVMGPPCGGKTTWVSEHAKPGDIRIDYDHLCNLIGGYPIGNHDYPQVVARLVRKARLLLIREALKQSETDVYIIHSTPSESALLRYAEAGCEFKRIDPGEAVVRERCARLRPKSFMFGVDKYYESMRKKPAPVAPDGGGGSGFWG